MPTAGSRWRVLAWRTGGKNEGEKVELTSEEHPSIFDELVIDNWFHLEQMDERRWWIGIYEGRNKRHTLNIEIDANGDARVVHEVEEW